MNCETLLGHAPGFLEGTLAPADHEAVVLHLEVCASCHALFSALLASTDPGLTDAILERTSGGACRSARSRLCDRIDGVLAPFDAELVDGHVRHCADCGALERVLVRLQADLPRLAAVDPGPGFTEAILARTSRRPRRVPLNERWAAAVSRLLERPRIALEGAFVAAALVVLPILISPAQLAGRPKHAIVDARGVMSELTATIQVGARSAWGTAQALVVENSARLRPGTLCRLGASRQESGESAQEERR